jgi:hypothetical protein
LKSGINLKTIGLSGQLRWNVWRLEHTKSLKHKEDPTNLVACCSSHFLQHVYLVLFILPIYSNMRVSPYHITWRWLIKCYVNTLSVLTNLTVPLIHNYWFNIIIITSSPQPLYSSKMTEVPTDLQARWAIEPVLTFWRTVNLLSLQGFEPQVTQLTTYSLYWLLYPSSNITCKKAYYCGVGHTKTTCLVYNTLHLLKALYTSDSVSKH